MNILVPALFLAYIILLGLTYHSRVTKDAFFLEYLKDYLPKFSYSHEGVVYRMESSEIVASKDAPDNVFDAMDILCRTQGNNWFLLALVRDYKLCAWNATMNVHFTPFSEADAKEWLLHHDGLVYESYFG